MHYSTRKFHDRIDHKLRDGRQLVIRSTEYEDFETLAEIYVKSYMSLNTGEVWSLRDARKMLEHIDDLKPALGMIAEVEGKIVGGIFSAAKPWENGNTVLHINEVFVDPEYQQMGIGTTLLKDNISRAIITDSITQVELETFSGRVHPESWYKSLGFENPQNPELQIMVVPIVELQQRFSRRGIERG